MQEIILGEAKGKKMFSSKDPEEKITITFDFSDLAESVSDPVITVVDVNNIDSVPSDILFSSPQVIQSNKVCQSIIDGINLSNYQFRCKVTTNTGDILIHTDILPVRTAPYIG
jgi:hypothetical protein